MDIKKSKINNISAYLQSSDSHNSLLAQIVQRAHQIRLIQSRLESELGSEFLGHLWVGNYQGGLLNLLVDSATLATKLRFSIPDIRDKLRQQPEWAGLKSIQVKILVTLPESS